MYAQIIPIRRMPFSLPFLDYAFSAEFERQILPGQLVKIEIRKKIEFGVVKAIINESKESLKPISGLVFQRPVFSSAQLSFLNEMSEFYKAPLSFLAKTNLLPLQKRKMAKIVEPAEIKTAKQTASKPRLFIYNSFEEKKNYIKKVLVGEGQILILVPEVNDIEKMINILDGTDAITYTSELSEKEKFSAWLDLWQGKKNIVVGTRAAIFLPWQNLTSIILDDEANINYKSWDMTPRFHTRDAATFLAYHHGAQLHIMTHTPSEESYYFSKHKIYQPEGKLDRFKIMPTIVNLKDEQRLDTFNAISPTVRQAIENSSGDVFLYVNRLGSYGYLACKDCNKPVNCPNCSKPLAVFENSKELRCRGCFAIFENVSSCPNCRSFNLRTFASGTQGIEKEARKFFPGKKVIRVDSENPDTTKLNIAEQKIIIGTEFAWPYVSWEKVGLMVFADIDSALLIPEYRAMEELWLKLRDASYRLKDAELYIQTRKPDHPIFTYLGSPDNFYINELKERRLFGYPPYNYLLRLFYGNTDPAEVKKQANFAYNKLKSLTDLPFIDKITGPLPMTPHFKNGKYWEVIAAKLPYDKYKKYAKIIVKSVGDDWRIDPNPITILSH